MEKNTSRKKVTKQDDKLVDFEVVEKEITDKLKKTKSLPKKENTKTQKNSFSLFEVILLIIITILSCILVGYFIVPTNTNKTKTIIDDKNVANFIEQYKYILDNYYGDIDEDKLINEAIKGMLSSLDNYSEIIDEESNSFSIRLNGEYEGVGIIIANDNKGNIIVQGVYKDTPADKAEILPGDMITKFNDMSLNGVSTTTLVSLISSSDDMKLTIVRDGVEMVKNISKESITIKSVAYEMLDDKIGYISIDIFALNTASQFSAAIDDLESQGMKSLIIDLRDNTGGHLSAVESMLSSLMNKKNVLYQLEDKDGITKYYSRGKVNKNYPIVVLQNSASASASEIMAAALKENLNSYIIGTRSFGKGTVQTLKDASTVQYKVTTKKWLTPKGTWVDGVGVTPDKTVELSEEYYQNPGFDTDNQLNAAIEYLK